MPLSRLSGAVGAARKGRPIPNLKGDVLTVQRLINRHIARIPPNRRLKLDGDCGPSTKRAIEDFQRAVQRIRYPDGVVDPGGATIKALRQPAVRNERDAVAYRTGPQEDLYWYAQAYVGARETGDNRMGTDPRMREIFEADDLVVSRRVRTPAGIRTVEATDGYPWCCAFVCLCVQKLLAGSPVHYAGVVAPRTALVRDFYTRYASSQRCRVFRPDDPEFLPNRGDIVVFTFSHIGIVKDVVENENGAVVAVTAIEGNTNARGSREGTAVLEKYRSLRLVRCFVRLPVSSPPGQLTMGDFLRGGY